MRRFPLWCLLLCEAWGMTLARPPIDLWLVAYRLDLKRKSGQSQQKKRKKLNAKQLTAYRVRVRFVDTNSRRAVREPHLAFL